jgi:D-threo-aldose 1-dehydrogenase
MSVLGFGGGPLGNLYQPVSDRQAAATVDAAWEAGLRVFDTAPYYGLGLSERRIGDALRARPRGDFVLSTKVGRLLEPDSADPLAPERHGFVTAMPFRVRFDYSYDGVMRSYEASLHRLGLARIDLLLVHDLGRATHGDEHLRHMAAFADGGYRAMDELRRNGDISGIGIGANESAVCAEVLKIGRFDRILLAGRYTLLEQAPLHDLFPQCAAHGARLILGGVYNSGILAIGTRAPGIPRFNYAPAPPEVVQRVRRIEAVCESHGLSLAAAALQFALAHPLVECVIPGLCSPQEVLQTLQLAQEPVPALFWRQLKDAALLDPDAPTPGAACAA